MPQQTKTFRVFVSSTFADMKEERWILQKQVFPLLEKYCESMNARFQAVDLRWGVNEEIAREQRTLELCLNEISRCQKISPKPNFIILLGDRYGWQPLPSKIPVTEMEMIHGSFTPEESNLISSWYRLDKNSIPAEFVLQPKGDVSGEFEDWNEIETKIRSILRKSVLVSSLSTEERIKYFASATHQEILKGALVPSEFGVNPEEHVLAFKREIIGLPMDASANKFIDILGNKVDEYSLKKVAELRDEVAAKLGTHCVHYNSIWKDGKSYMENRNDFANKSYFFLKDIIESQLHDLPVIHELKREISLHKAFKARLNEHFKGRKEILERIDNYIGDAAERRVLSLLGPSGSGKSSVLAQAIKRQENSSSVLVYRFLGTTSISSSVTPLLRNVCEQIANAYGIDKIESLADDSKDISLHKIQDLTALFKKCLSLATKKRPLLIFLDALDQLSVNENTSSFYWVPGELPKYCKVIVSSLPYLEKSLSRTLMEQLHILPVKEARQILKSWLNTNHRTLTEIQLNLVLEKFKKTRLPIFLKLAFERVNHWHSYDTENTLNDDVSEIVNDFFDWLEHEHTEELVRNVTCYLLCGRYEGLTENEILEVLVFDKDYWDKVFLPKSYEEHRIDLTGATKIPIIVWSRLFLDLEPFLTEKDADGVPIITFFHNVFNTVLKDRYELHDKIEGIKFNMNS